MNDLIKSLRNQASVVSDPSIEERLRDAADALEESQQRIKGLEYKLSNSKRSLALYRDTDKENSQLITHVQRLHSCIISLCYSHDRRYTFSPSSVYNLVKENKDNHERNYVDCVSELALYTRQFNKSFKGFSK